MHQLRHLRRRLCLRISKIAKVVVEKRDSEAQRSDQGPQYPKVVCDPKVRFLGIKVEELRAKNRLYSPSVRGELLDTSVTYGNRGQGEKRHGDAGDRFH